MNHKNYLACAALLFCTLQAAGQDSTKWSLQTCIDYAMEHNIQLKQNRVAEEQGAADLAQKKAELFPSLSLSTTQSIDYRPLQKSASNIVTNGIACAHRMMELGEQFIKLEPEEPKLFYVWGHSYEFDYYDTWERFETFCRMMSVRTCWQTSMVSPCPMMAR